MLLSHMISPADYQLVKKMRKEDDEKSNSIKKNQKIVQEALFGGINFIGY